MADSKDNKKKTVNKKKVVLCITGITGVLLLIVLIGYGVVVHYIHKMNYVPLAENYTIASETSPYIDDVIGPSGSIGDDTDDAELIAYQNAAEKALKKLGLKYDELDEVYNVLLIGSDTRNPNDKGRSDTMMLISINKDTKEIIATSFLRDLYVKIPKRDTYDKINAAYAYGGVELLLDTLEYNFSLSVDRYISVDFQAFIDVIDILGGLDVNVQKDELYWLNQYIHASNLLIKCPDENDGYLTKADGSYQHLNGKQVLAYSRFRYVGNGDFTRTERQRKVMNLAFDKIKQIDVGTLINLLDDILPQITTNIPTNEFIELISTIPRLKKYDVVSWGIPDGDFKYLTIGGQSHIGIDFEYYIKRLHNKIYSIEPETTQAHN